VTVEALAYFEGGDLDSLDAATCALLVAESVRDLETPVLPILSARLDA
jgi:hypothetical protein